MKKMCIEAKQNTTTEQKQKEKLKQKSKRPF